MTQKGKNKNWMIEAWMGRHVSEFVDHKTGEVNTTDMVETWDRECSSGEETLDPDHIAWEVAVKVAESFEQTNK